MAKFETVGDLAEGEEQFHYKGYKDFDPDAGSFSYGDLVYGWKEGELNFYVPKYCSGSDYSGGLVSKSNFEVFMDEFGDRDGVYEVYGGYGSYGVAIDVDVADQDMIETLAALYEYPLISEDHHSELEAEAQREAWDSWARDDFVRAVEKELDVDGDDVDEDKLLKLFHEATERASVYWEDEREGVFIDVDEAAAEVDLEDALEAGFVEEDDE